MSKGQPLVLGAWRMQGCRDAPAGMPPEVTGIVGTGEAPR